MERFRGGAGRRNGGQWPVVYWRTGGSIRHPSGPKLWERFWCKSNSGRHANGLNPTPLIGQSFLRIFGVPYAV